MRRFLLLVGAVAVAAVLVQRARRNTTGSFDRWAEVPRNPVAPGTTD